jgi:hypothetical protein
MYHHLIKSLPASTAAVTALLVSASAASSKDAKCHHETKKDVLGMLHDLDERVSWMDMDAS